MKFGKGLNMESRKNIKDHTKVLIWGNRCIRKRNMTGAAGDR